MPLIFAFRVVDCVLAMGVKVLFQIGLGKNTCSFLAPPLEKLTQKIENITQLY